MKAPVLFALLLVAGCATPERVEVAPAMAVDRPVAVAAAGGNPAIGGVVLPADGTIAAGLAAVPSLATLTRAATAAGLTPTLAGTAPLTLFAPSEEAWTRLAPGTVDALMKPENRSALGKMVGLHLVRGRYAAADLLRLVAAGNGRATLTTVAGEPLVLTLTGSVVTLTDAGGNKSYVETADVRQANGVIHVVNGVLVPRLTP